MFEGKNIHLSPIDGKPLCSFSKKLCRQRRLHNYAFCIRHILEDTNSPFKQCPYQTKSGDICINAVPIAAAREYVICLEIQWIFKTLKRLFWANF